MKSEIPLPFVIRSLACLGVLSGSTGFAQDQKPAPGKVDFIRDVKPLFEGACVQCHRPDSDEKNGNYFMDTKDGAFKGGETYGVDVINPDDVNDSPVYWMTTVHEDDPEDPEAMPPKRPLNKQQIKIIHDWIAGGAEWPEDLVLDYTPRVLFAGVKPTLQRGPPFSALDVDTLRYWAALGADWPEGGSLADKGDQPADDLELTRSIRETILKSPPVKSEAEMMDYASTIPKTGAEYEMIAIKGGEFTMGSPASESGRNDDEGPQHPVKIDPFWMGKLEVTWDMYEPFMITSFARNKDGSRVKLDPDPEAVDIVTSPTTPYVEMSFGMGTQGFPAISMTQHAANKFCEWLSAQTGHFYRLPTEAEWEYACRAGTTGPFHCAEEDLDQYAVFDPTGMSRRGYGKVGTKKPNPWGLHDMHGNVLEWCLDQYEPNYDSRAGGGVADNPLVRPETLYPRVARGGSWYDTAGYLRSAARTFSEEGWKQLDPQLPKSIWYHTDATWLGFRVVRPLAIPELEEMHELWNLGIKDQQVGVVMSLLDPGEDPADFEKEIQPLLERGGPFSPEEIELIRRWTRGGANWPADTKLEFE